jgi:hypothetical protein
MSTYRKRTTLALICALMLIYIEACKKDYQPTSPSYPKSDSDYRDSLVGGFQTYLTDTGAAHVQVVISSDSIIGPAVVAISKYPGDDSSLVVLGEQFKVFTTGTQTIQYATPNPFGTPDILFMTLPNDSIWVQQTVYEQAGSKYFYYYTGRKQ